MNPIDVIISNDGMNLTSQAIVIDETGNDIGT
jgi:hypothetical protein